MTEERKSIIRGILYCLRIHNKKWKMEGSEEELLLMFGDDDKITEDEVKEFMQELKKAA